MNSISSGTASYTNSSYLQSRDNLRKNLPQYFSNPDCRLSGKGLAKTHTGCFQPSEATIKDSHFAPPNFFTVLFVEIKMMSCEDWGASAWIIDRLLASNHMKIVSGLLRRISQNTRKRHHGSSGRNQYGYSGMVGGAPHDRSDTVGFSIASEESESDGYRFSTKHVALVNSWRHAGETYGIRLDGGDTLTGERSLLIWDVVSLSGVGVV